MKRRQLLGWALGSLFAAAAAPVRAARFLSGDLQSANGGTRLILEADQRIAYRHFTLDSPRRLVLDIDEMTQNQALAALAKKAGGSDSLVSGIRIGQKDAKTVRIVLDLKRAVRTRFTALAPSGSLKHRLQIDLTPTAAAPAKTAKADSTPAEPADPLLALIGGRSGRAADTKKNTPAPTVSSNTTAKPAPPAVPKRKPVVMLDPGHGGRDPGAIGPTGLKEKDLALAVAQETKKRLEAQGCQVYLTRTGDSFVHLRERRRRARSVKADLFVSIHANAAESAAAKGTEVFVWGRANSERVRKLAQKENDADMVDGIPSVGNKDVDSILTDMMQTQTTADSTRLGNLVLRQLGRHNSLRHNSVESANFVVLRSLDIPSILIELAFLSNPDEEKLLKTAAFRRKLADAVAGGVGQYLKNAVLR